MQFCHNESIKLLIKFLDGLDFLGTERALEVAAGEGRTSKGTATAA